MLRQHIKYKYNHRFPNSYSIPRIILFIITLPLCTVLSVIRFFIGLQGLIILCLLPKSLKLRR